jgi:hypothetical protein
VASDPLSSPGRSAPVSQWDNSKKPQADNGKKPQADNGKKPQADNSKKCGGRRGESPRGKR